MEYDGRPLSSDKIQYHKHPILGALVWLLGKSGVLREEEEEEEGGGKGAGTRGGGRSDDDDDNNYNNSLRFRGVGGVHHTKSSSLSWSSWSSFASLTGGGGGGEGGDSSELINFNKLRKIGNILSMIEQSKSAPYKFEKNDQLLRMLSCKPRYQTEDECWNRSKSIEAKLVT